MGRNYSWEKHESHINILFMIFLDFMSSFHIEFMSFFGFLIGLYIIYIYSKTAGRNYSNIGEKYVNHINILLYTHLKN